MMELVFVTVSGDRKRALKKEWKTRSDNNDGREGGRRQDWRRLDSNNDQEWRRLDCNNEPELWDVLGWPRVGIVGVVWTSARVAGTYTNPAQEPSKNVEVLREGVCHVSISYWLCKWEILDIYVRLMIPRAPTANTLGDKPVVLHMERRD